MSKRPLTDGPPNRTRGASTSAISRRTATGLVVGAGIGLFTPAIAQGGARVVVVGGGSAGATAARYIAKESGNVRVTLVTDSRHYTTCIFSNLYLAGLRSLSSLTHSYDTLAKNHGIEVVRRRAVAIELTTKRVLLADSEAISYDRLVVAPGISFDTSRIQGYDTSAAERMPHAYRAGFQTFLLRRQLLGMRRGGVVVIAPPQNPYRCPPGPYERTSLIAKLMSRINPTAKILVIDAKDTFAKQAVFEDAWRNLYPGMIEWAPGSFTNGGIVAVDARDMTVTTGDGQRIRVDVASIIPPQRAGAIAIASGLTDASGWSPVDGATMRSTIDPNVFVLGDSARAGQMPKSGFAANSQAHVAALAVRADLEGVRMFPAKFRNTCWSFVDNQNVVKVGASYAVEDGEIRVTNSFASQVTDEPEIRFENTLEANHWYSAITADMFS